MADNSKKTGGDGVAWLLLLLCLGVVGFTVYSSGGFSEIGKEKDVFLRLDDIEGEQGDNLFAFETEESTQDASETEPVTLGVFATEAETEEPPTTETPTTEPPPTEPPLPFSKTDPLLVLVNKDREYAGEAPEVKQWRTGGISVSTEAYDALASMIDAGQKLGLRFVVCSGYRSREVQEQLFQEDLNRYMRGGMSYEEAWTATERYTMPPGHSEHCTGLAVDIVAQSNQHLDSTQESTAETRWLQTHCWEYGFVLRYPKDKSSITGIAYESWHYRYVGKEAAKYLTENNLTLEEFHDQT